MQLLTPLPFLEAVQKLGLRDPIVAALTSSEWRDVPLSLRERAFFSARVENARFLQRAKDALTEFLTSARETLPSGQTALRTGGRAQFVRDMLELAEAEGMGPLRPEDAGTIKDITSQRRLELIFDVQTRQANDYGYWLQGQDPDILDEYPAQRFIRVREVKEARDWHTQFEGKVFLKSDLAMWRTINKDFGVPWGPWGWGCGHDVEDVPREEAEQLGLIQPGQHASQAVRTFNEGLKTRAAELDPEMLEYLRHEFRDQIALTGDTIAWRR